MKQALENATDEDRAAISEMLNDLNELLDKHARGKIPNRTSTTSWTVTVTNFLRTHKTLTNS